MGAEFTVTKLPHSGMLVESGGVKLVFDPLLRDAVIEGTFALTDVVSPELRRSASQVSALFLSHAHEDHFDLLSLIEFDPQTPIYVPDGALNMILLLRRAGFRSIRTMSPEEVIDFGAISVIPTISQVPFPECGFIVRTAGMSVWNLVDSQVDGKTLRQLRSKYGRPDVLFSYEQPTLEGRVPDLSILWTSCSERLEEVLAPAAILEPSWLIPSGSDFVNVLCPWLNEFLFPLRRGEFLQLARNRSPNLRPQAMFVGDRLEFKNKTLVYRKGRSRPGPGSYRPSWPEEHADWKAEVSHTLQVALKARHNATYHELLVKKRVHWTLQVTNESGGTEEISFDFANGEGETRLFTCVGLGPLLGFIRNEVSPYALRYGGLLYWTGEDDPALSEPLSTLLYKQVCDSINDALLVSFRANEK